MINSGVHIGTNSKLIQRGSGHFHISDPYKYCRELDLVIQVAKSKGYQLPTDYQLRCIDILIKELISNSIFNKYDLLYIDGLDSLHSNTLTVNSSLFPSLEIPRNTIENFTNINIANPLLYERTILKNATRPNLPYYTRYGYKYGISGTGGGALNTNYIVGVNSINWTQNNAGYFTYLANYDDASAASVTAGVRDTANNRTALRLTPWSTTNTIQGNINTTNTAAVNYGASTTSVGHFRLERTASNLTSAYKSGILNGTAATVSQTMIGLYPIYLGGQNMDNTSIANQHTRSPISYHGIGAALGSTLQKIEFEIFKSFREKLNII